MVLIIFELFYIFCIGGVGIGKFFLFLIIVEFIKLYYFKISGCSLVLVKVLIGVVVRNVLGFIFYFVFKLFV